MLVSGVEGLYGSGFKKQHQAAFILSIFSLDQQANEYFINSFITVICQTYRE